MGLTKFAIDLAVKLKNIEDYNTYLFIGPHPDDIEIGAGATVKRLTQMGKRVVFLICTDGRYGKENCKDVTCERLVEIRQAESIKSANILGVKEIYFLGLSDGNQYAYDQLLYGIAEMIDYVKPDMLLTVDPDSTAETHMDHLNVGRAVKELANFANYPEIFERYLDRIPRERIDIHAVAFFMTAHPNRYVRVSKTVKAQIQAIMAHESQYPKGSALDSVLLYLKLRRIEFGFKSLKGAAEGFRVLDRTRMHCLPEAGN